MVGLLSLAGVVSGHGAGASFEEVVGAYAVDVGYDTPTFMEEETTAFDFALFDNATKDEVSFTDAWVVIEHENHTLFATGIKKSEFGRTTLLYTFPLSGNLSMSVRFQNNGEEIVEAVFPLLVEAAPKPGGNSSQSIIAGIIGLLIGLAVSFIFKK